MSDRERTESFDPAQLGFLALGAGALVVLTKYFIPILCGALVGLFLWLGSVRGALVYRVLRPVAGLLLLGAILYLLVGSPYPSPRRFMGVLGGADSFHDFMRGLAAYWNSFWPPELKFMWFRTATPLHVAQWYWLFFASSLFTLLLVVATRLTLNLRWVPDRALVLLAEAPYRPLVKVSERLSKNLRRADPSGFEIGTDPDGNPFRLSEKNLGYHVQIIAPTGGGKTNLLKLLIENRIRRGHGIIVLDYKGDSELMRWTYEMTSALTRGDDFRVVSLVDPETSAPYNPLSSKDPIELHSQLMNSMTWSEDFYRKVASTVLITLLVGLTEHERITGQKFHLGTVCDLICDEEALAEFASLLHSRGAKSADSVSDLAASLSRSTYREKVMGLAASLELIRKSSAGDLMTHDAEAGSFSMSEAMEEGRVAFFSVNSLKLKESATVLGRLILQDLLQQIGRRYCEGGPFKPVTVVIDEFASFAVPQFIEFLDRARGAGVSIVVAHQSRADLEEVTAGFKDRVEANMNTSIVSGVRAPEEAEHFSGMIGTRATTAETVQRVRSGLVEADTGVRSSRIVEEFVVHPNRLKALNQGQMLVICRTIDPKWGIVHVQRARDGQKFTENDFRTRMSTIRARYRSGRGFFLKLGAGVPASPPSISPPGIGCCPQTSRAEALE